MQRVPSSEGGIIIATIPVVTAFLTPVFMREKVHVLQYVFVVCSLLGVVLMIGVNALKGDILGDLFLFMAVLTAAFYSFISRKLSKDFTPQEITFFMMLYFPTLPRSWRYWLEWWYVLKSCSGTISLAWG